MSASLSLNTVARRRVGKESARATRAKGRVPAVVYGLDKPPSPISIDKHDVKRAVESGKFFATIFDLYDNEDDRKDSNRAPFDSVIPREIQRHPVDDRIHHVDFLRVRPDSEVHVDVAVNFINHQLCPGIKRGGLLNTVRHEIQLICRADSIPGDITINLEGLIIGDSIHISHVDLPEGTRPAIIDRDFTIATIAAPKGMTVEEEKAEEGEAEDESDEPEEAKA